MFEVYQGSSLDVIKNHLYDKVIHCVVTSPPYFNKREYGEDDREIGREKNVNQFIKSLCDIFDSINLHPNGSVWVNLGDKRDKDGSLLMIPEKFAISMKAHGWKLVDSVIWAKVIDEENGETEGGCMIEPAAGRLNGNGYENFYRFTKTSKAASAWSDTCAVRIPREGVELKRYLPNSIMSVENSINGRNLHNVWRVKMGQTKYKHFAVFPEALIERPIAMTCPPMICQNCGHLSERIIEMVEYNENRGSKRVFGKYNSIANKEDIVESGRMDSGKGYIPKYPKTIKWSNCECNEKMVPGIVFDPFCGTGTVGEVAIKMGRRFIGIDLYEKFKNITEERCKKTVQFIESNKLDPLRLITQL